MMDSFRLIPGALIPCEVLDDVIIVEEHDALDVLRVAHGLVPETYLFPPIRIKQARLV